MSADSICQIVKYVRQNAHEKPELWPFARGGDKNRYFNLDGGLQSAGPECKLRILDRKDGDPQLIVGLADFKETWCVKFHCDNIMTYDKKGSDNIIDIDPDLVELFIYAPEIDKRSALFQARHPSFELPVNYPGTIKEAIVECQCPLYVPTPTGSDDYEKYRAVNIDYLEKHQPTIYNYVTRIATDYEDAAIKLNSGNFPTNPAIKIGNGPYYACYDAVGLAIDTPAGGAALAPQQFAIVEKGGTEAVFGVTPEALTFTNGGTHSTLTRTTLELRNDNSNLALKMGVDYPPYIQGLVNFGLPKQIPTFTLSTDSSISTRGYLNLRAIENNVQVTLQPISPRNYLLSLYRGDIAPDNNVAYLYHFDYQSSQRGGHRNFDEIWTSNLKVGTQEINETHFVYLRSNVNGRQQTARLMFGCNPDNVPIHPNNFLWWFEDTPGSGKSAYLNWVTAFENSSEVIEDQFDPEEIHPVRSVIRCHHINGRKAVSNYIQFDDNTEMIIWRRYLDEDCEQINDNSLIEFMKTEQYKAILKNRYNQARAKEPS